MEKQLRVSTKNPNHVISGHFHYTRAIISACLFSAPIDIELDDLVRPQDNPAFTRVRYDLSLTDRDPFAAQNGLALDNLKIIPYLDRFGAKHALENVALSHFR